MSRELEERVARLEAGLHDFQRSLQQMTTSGRSRRPNVLAGTTPPQAALNLDTPSMLADTLQNVLSPSSYEYAPFSLD